VFSTLEVCCENALYTFTYDIHIVIEWMFCIGTTGKTGDSGQRDADEGAGAIKKVRNECYVHISVVVGVFV